MLVDLSMKWPSTPYFTRSQDQEKKKSTVPMRGVHPILIDSDINENHSNDFDIWTNFRTKSTSTSIY